MSLNTVVGFVLTLFLVAGSVRANASYLCFEKPGETTAPVEVTTNGIPFLNHNLWSTTTEGETLRLELGGIAADELYILGGLNSMDRANIPWGGGKSYHNLFVGDQAGTISLNYKSGMQHRIPLIFGYNLFWRDPFANSFEPFQSDPGARRLLDNALSLANGTTYVAEHRYIPIRPGDKQLIQSIEIEDEVAKEGHPVIQGITVLTSAKPSDSLPFKASAVTQPDSAARSWLDAHIIHSKDPFPASRKEAVRQLAQLMYTFPDDITLESVQATPPAITESNFSGPKIRFTGPPEAAILTHVYFENADGITKRVEPTGMLHESEVHADNYGGFGGYRPDLHPFWDSSYTRTRTLIQLTDLGYTELAESSLNFFDNWLMYFPCSYPQLQLGGKPVPGHWTVVANKPHLYFDTLRHVGWHTKFQTRDFGNPETDGHGIMMLSHWRQWLKLGRPAQWVRAHWPEIREAAEYIPWHLDNPQLSFSTHGLLYAESEGGMQKPSIYCDAPCLLGLRAYSTMAAVAGETTSAQRWREVAQNLELAMEKYYPLKSPQWGDVWDPEKQADWFTGHAVLAPVLFGMDYFGYDVMAELPPHWAERSRRTYRMQLMRNEPEWCAPAGIGYGQCAIAEVALLMDQMADAEKLVHWLARFCFHPRQKFPYRVPEGISISGDAAVWRRWGDLGNLFQTAETVYTINLIAGIDDTDAEVLKLMPRIPPSWTGVEVWDRPVRIKSHGKPELAMLTMKLDRVRTSTWEADVRTDKPVDQCTLRIGPFPSATSALTAVVDGNPVHVSPLVSGDTVWASIRLNPDKLEHTVKVIGR